VAEIIRQFEGDGLAKIQDQKDAYEQLLNQMFDATKDLELKTEIHNPNEMSRYYFIIDAINGESESELESENFNQEVAMMQGLGTNMQKFWISYNRQSRKEAFDTIKSYNMRKEMFDDDVDTEKFKRLIKTVK